MFQLRFSWCRFSLQTFLIVITFVAIWVAVETNRASGQRRAVEALSNYGYVIYEHEFVNSAAMQGSYGGKNSQRVDWGRETPGPRWIRRLVGDDYFRRVVNVDVAAHPDVFEQIQNLSDIKKLRVDAYYLRDEDLAKLGMLPKLRHLSIMGAPQVSDDGLKHLLAANLRFLSITHTPITDRAVETLSQLKQLEQLGLAYTNVTVEGSEKLRNLLPNTEVTMNEAQRYAPPQPPTNLSGMFTTNHSVR